MHNKSCPQYLSEYLPPVASDISGCNLRNKENQVLPRCRLRISEKSFIPSTVRIWNNLSPTIRNLQTISQFKLQIKGEQFRPPVYYGEGSRKFNILHTRLRHQCSSFKAGLTKIHVVDDPKCSYGSPIEDAIHYLLECQLCYNQRISLFNDLNNMNIEINIETLLFGNDTYTDHTNQKKNQKVFFFAFLFVCLFV